jgi:hypothetical protein
MKKQNPNNKLAFNKVAVTELNERQLQDVNGGTVITSIVYSIIDLSLI